MGYARHSRQDPAGTPTGLQRHGPTPTRIARELPADYFDMPPEVAGKTGRELVVLRQARQMRDAWRRERYGRLRGT